MITNFLDLIQDPEFRKYAYIDNSFWVYTGIKRYVQINIASNLMFPKMLTITFKDNGTPPEIDTNIESVDVVAVAALIADMTMEDVKRVSKVTITGMQYVPKFYVSYGNRIVVAMVVESVYNDESINRIPGFNKDTTEGVSHFLHYGYERCNLHDTELDALKQVELFMLENIQDLNRQRDEIGEDISLQENALAIVRAKIADNKVVHHDHDLVELMDDGERLVSYHCNTCNIDFTLNLNTGEQTPFN